MTSLRRPLPGQRVHFVGAGGVGMAALAELLADLGYSVSGSDIKESGTTRRLGSKGIAVAIGAHDAANVGDVDLVVFNNAIRETNVEVLAARDRGIETMPRSRCWAATLDAGRGIAVSGTHGKTTTSSMVAVVLQGCGFDPSFLIGGDLNDVGSGSHLGSSDFIVAEADDAFRTFLELHPEIAVVTNVAMDHLGEPYIDQDDIDTAFVQFLAQRRGPAVLCGDDPGVRRILPDVIGDVVLYGHDAGARMRIGADRTLSWDGAPLGPVTLQMPGEHNVLNAAAAASVAMLLGGEPAAILSSLARFGGVQRRFTLRGEQAGVRVYDDYAHNPQKVAAAVAGARERYPDARIVAVFQPHLYSRTRMLAAEFGRSFMDADVVVVTDVFGSREEPEPGVSGLLICEAIRATSGAPREVLYVPLLDQVAGFVAGLTRPGDVIITLGAGDVTTVGPRLLELLS